jgi:dynein heavy chain
MSDHNLIYGELSDTPIGVLDCTVSKLYKPIFDTREDWGVAKKTATDSFTENLSRFGLDVTDALSSMVGGVELRRPDKQYDIDMEARKPEKNEEMMAHLLAVLDTWCTQVDSVMDGPEGVDPAGNMGPLSELEFWRRRMQQLSSLVEQLKTKECRNVLALLAGTAKASGLAPAVQAQVVQALRKWKQVPDTTEL